MSSQEISIVEPGFEVYGRIDQKMRNDFMLVSQKKIPGDWQTFTNSKGEKVTLPKRKLQEFSGDQWRLAPNADQKLDLARRKKIYLSYEQFDKLPNSYFWLYNDQKNVKIKTCRRIGGEIDIETVWGIVTLKKGDSVCIQPNGEIFLVKGPLHFCGNSVEQKIRRIVAQNRLPQSLVKMIDHNFTPSIMPFNGGIRFGNDAESIVVELIIRGYGGFSRQAVSKVYVTPAVDDDTLSVFEDYLFVYKSSSSPALDYYIEQEQRLKGEETAWLLQQAEEREKQEAKEIEKQRDKLFFQIEDFLQTVQIIKTVEVYGKKYTYGRGKVCKGNVFGKSCNLENLFDTFPVEGQPSILEQIAEDSGFAKPKIGYNV